MPIIGLLVSGLVTGFVASRIYEGTGQGVMPDVVLGTVGAVVGGFLFTAFGAAPVTGSNLYSMLVAIVGAVVVLWLYHAVFDRRRA